MPLRVGLVGCGDISGIYFRNAAIFRDIEIVACASRRLAQADSVGAKYGVPARTVDALIAARDIDVVLNLTPPLAHAAITKAALAAGKHVYSEKPLGVDLAEARELSAFAAARGLRLGVAPDTVLGPAVQTAARLVADGAIGRPIFGTAAFMSSGPETFHPAPDFFYARGGGPALDIGPYYLSALATILGPVAKVTAKSTIASPTRVVNASALPSHGRTIAVQVPTTVAALLDFAGGAIVSFVASWDAHNHGLPHIELHGTAGSLRVPNPDWFGGDVLLSRQPGVWEKIPTDAFRFGRPNRNDEAGEPVADYRGLGLAEMARAIAEERPHRASDRVALHVAAVIDALGASAGLPVAVAEPLVAAAPFGEESAATL
jgi:predicted dehydrogenase